MAALAVTAAMEAVLAASGDSGPAMAVMAALAVTAAREAAAAVKVERAEQVAVVASMRTLGGAGGRKRSGDKEMPRLHRRKACCRRAHMGLPNARNHCRT